MQDLLALIFVIVSFVVYFAITYYDHEHNSERFKAMIEDYERLATIRRISELTHVDEVLAAKIKEIAANDPEREVAAVARELLRSATF